MRRTFTICAALAVLLAAASVRASNYHPIYDLPTGWTVDDMLTTDAGIVLLARPTEGAPRYDDSYVVLVSLTGHDSILLALRDDHATSVATLDSRAILVTTANGRTYRIPLDGSVVSMPGLIGDGFLRHATHCPARGVLAAAGSKVGWLSTGATPTDVLVPIATLPAPPTAIWCDASRAFVAVQGAIYRLDFDDGSSHLELDWPNLEVRRIAGGAISGLFAVGTYQYANTVSAIALNRHPTLGWETTWSAANQRATDVINTATSARLLADDGEFVLSHPSGVWHLHKSPAHLNRYTTPHPDHWWGAAFTNPSRDLIQAPTLFLYRTPNATHTVTIP